MKGIVTVITAFNRCICNHLKSLLVYRGTCDVVNRALQLELSFFLLYLSLRCFENPI